MLELKVQFSSDFPESGSFRLQEDGDALPEYGQVWIWDMVYAQTLHALVGTEAARALREDLELWAINMSSKVFQPLDHIREKGYLNLRPDLVPDESVNTASFINFRISGEAGAMPQIEIDNAGGVSAEHQARAVMVLGQYFINHNEFFAKELPLHILAFRKFYADVMAESDPRSIEDAPMFAIQKALEYFNSAAGRARH